MESFFFLLVSKEKNVAVLTAPKQRPKTPFLQEPLTGAIRPRYMNFNIFLFQGEGEPSYKK